MKTLINQHKDFISQCKTQEDIDKRIFHLERCYEGKIPQELIDELDKQKTKISNGKDN